MCTNRMAVRCELLTKLRLLHKLRPGSIMRSLSINAQPSIESISKILSDLLPRIEHPCRYEQIVYLLNLFVNRYVCQGGKRHLWEFEKVFYSLMFLEHKYIGCLLLFLTIHLSWIKGGSRFKRMLIRYLEDT